MKIGVVILVFGGVLIYTAFSSRIFVAGPQIEISSPQSGSTIDATPLVAISGMAENVAHIWLNGRRIFTDESGDFQETVLLYPGYNVIKFNAVDKFDRSTEETLKLVYAGERIGLDKMRSESVSGDEDEGSSDGGESDAGASADVSGNESAGASADVSGAGDGDDDDEENLERF